MSHLTFMPLRRQMGKKTDIFHVFNEDDEMLGTIHWRAGWRQYVFTELYDGNVIDWSWDCLKEKSDFIRSLMDERKVRK
jgi:hypothetical protein